MRDYVFPMFRANTVYEGQYLLGTSIARPLIAKKQIEIAQQRSAPTRSATAPPARATTRSASSSAIMHWSPTSTSSRLGVNGTSRAARRCSTSPRSTRSRSPRTSAATRPSRWTPTCCTPPPRGRCWRIRRWRLPEFVHQRTIAPEDAPDKPHRFHHGFRGRRSGGHRRGEGCPPPTLLTKLNELGHDNGVGRLDLVENRFVGMKSRGVYETPGGTILLAAHRGIESITLDRGSMHMKDELMPKYASL